MSDLVLFIDENHCRNPHILAALEQGGVAHEKHLDYFAPGTSDHEWIPVIAGRGWVLLTADARIRTNEIERTAVRESRLKMFYLFAQRLRRSRVRQDRYDRHSADH